MSEITKQDGTGTTPTKILCPYCGHLQAFSDRCNACGGPFEPLSRMATQIAMGPWFLRDTGNPFKPGFSYSTLKKMIAAGKISSTTVMRGPSTHQFWAIARNVPGVSHMLGYCHACGKKVDKRERNCPHCMAAFRPVKDRDRLGLQYPTDTAVKRAREKLNEALGIQEPATAEVADGKRDALDDLLSEDLGGSSTQPSVTTGGAFSEGTLMSVPEGETATLSTSENVTPPTAPGGAATPATPPQPAAAPAQPQLTQPQQQPMQHPYYDDRPHPNAPISPIVWVLIGLNLLFVAGLGLLIYFVFSN